MQVRKEAKLNAIFDRFKLQAICDSFLENELCEIYKVSLFGKCKISSIKSIAKEIGLSLGMRNEPFINLDYDSQRISICFIKDKRPILNHFKQSEDSTIIGLDYDMNDVSVKLEDCPHILIGGSTGSGKTSLLKTFVRDLQEKGVVYVFDPKTTEFSNSFYDTLFVFNNKLNYGKLMSQFVVSMENRFKNKNNKDFKIFIIIDELADILASDKTGEFKENLCLLAQKSRSVGIHIIAATQRPSAKILDGDIKANFPVRIACKTATHIDSKVILDKTGAETLAGKGDCIMMYGGKEIRFQSLCP